MGSEGQEKQEDWVGGAIRTARPADELLVSPDDYLEDQGLRYVRPYHFHFVANVKKCGNATQIEGYEHKANLVFTLTVATDVDLQAVGWQDCNRAIHARVPAAEQRILRECGKKRQPLTGGSCSKSQPVYTSWAVDMSLCS